MCAVGHSSDTHLDLASASSSWADSSECWMVSLWLSLKSDSSPEVIPATMEGVAPTPPCLMWVLVAPSVLWTQPMALLRVVCC